ncbi:hypothetical protein IMCC3317_02230 [Kordia antarctica]|uniref:Uncharacterized protein n=1 Tax=Kordia antarctica TaxID=1218801 RepID=A0A7L4ZDJ8_9FLAO|nr:hypothetical protein IMCC3317_02230 [Kordia antarctica]
MKTISNIVPAETKIGVTTKVFSNSNSIAWNLKRRFR